MWEFKGEYTGGAKAYLQEKVKKELKIVILSIIASVIVYIPFLNLSIVIFPLVTVISWLYPFGPVTLNIAPFTKSPFVFNFCNSNLPNVSIAKEKFNVTGSL